MEIMTIGFIVAVNVFVHPLASVTVTLQVPMHNPTAAEVVCPLHHKNVYGVVPPDVDTVAVPVHKIQLDVVEDMKDERTVG